MILILFSILRAALVVAFLLAVAIYQQGKHTERQGNVLRQLNHEIQIGRERVKDDAQARNLSDYDFCMQSLVRRGVRSRQECEQLRGLAAE